MRAVDGRVEEVPRRRVLDPLEDHGLLAHRRTDEPLLAGEGHTLPKPAPLPSRPLAAAKPPVPEEKREEIWEEIREESWEESQEEN